MLFAIQSSWAESKPAPKESASFPTLQGANGGVISFHETTCDKKGSCQLEAELIRNGESVAKLRLFPFEKNHLKAEKLKSSLAFTSTPTGSGVVIYDVVPVEFYHGELGIFLTKTELAEGEGLPLDTYAALALHTGKKIELWNGNSYGLGGESYEKAQHQIEGQRLIR